MKKFVFVKNLPVKANGSEHQNLNETARKWGKRVFGRRDHSKGQEGYSVMGLQEGQTEKRIQ